MEKKQSSAKKWGTLAVLILGGGTIYKLPYLKDAFYVPMQQLFHLTNTQIGELLSVYAIVQTIGYFSSIYLTDRFSKRKLLPFGLIGVGVLGLFLLTSPGYTAMLILWGLFALFAEVLFWPVLVKTVRLLGNEDEQGRMFGLLEMGRGIVDTIVAFSALGIFKALGEGTRGLKGAIIFYAVIDIIIAIVTYAMVEDDAIVKTDNGREVSQNKVAMQGALKALKMPEVWLVSLNIFAVYSVYCGLTSFIPFLKDIYGLPAVLVGAYGIINQYGLKMIGGPVGGFLSDKAFKSPSKYIRVAFVAAAVVMTIFLFLPHQSMNVYAGMAFTLGFGAIIFTMRAVFFAPMEEVGVPREISGAASSIACLVGYAPSMFAFPLYGSLIDRTPGIGGYKHVFMVMIAFSVFGFFVSSALVRMVNKKKIAANGAM